MMRRSFSAFAILSLWGILGLFQAAVCSAQAPQLRYGVQADQKLSYKIGIEAQVGDGRVTHDGVITYIVKSATPDSFVITTSGGLNKQIHVNNPGMMGPPFGMMGPPMGMMGGPRMTGPTEVTFNRLGRAIAASNLNDLPFVLGWREMLVFEPLPATPQPTWVEEHGVSIVETERASRPVPMFFPGGGQSTTERAATERTEYAVVGSQPGAVKISKKYSLLSNPALTERTDMTGTGEVVFDPAQGVIRSITMHYELTEFSNGASTKAPIKLTCELLTGEALAQHEKEEADRQAKHQQMVAELQARAEGKGPQGKFGEGEREKLLEELKSGDWMRARTAADRLSQIAADDHPEDFSKPLAKLLANDNGLVQWAAAGAIAVWVTPEAEEALIDACESHSGPVRDNAIRALAKIPSEGGAEAVAGQLANSPKEAGEALLAMGPVAEEAVIGCLRERNREARKAACELLRKIGGEASLAALEAYGEKANEDELDAIDTAVGAIRGRLRRAARSGAPSFRTWRDASGQFEIEAVMVESKDSSVTLKKKNGATVKVPLEKLSDDDREYVKKQLAKAQE